MKRSKGRVSKKTRLLGRRTRGHKVTPSELVKTLEIGASVQLVPHGEFEDFPHTRYAGRVGIITGKRGNAYIVEVKDGGLIKKFITSPVHLKLIKLIKS